MVERFNQIYFLAGLDSVTRILVTGGSGFIGASLIRRLLDLKLEVVNLDLVEGPGLYVKRDIRSPIEGSDIFAGVDACIHLAALAKEPGYDREEYFATNLYGTRNVLDLCSVYGISSVVFTSTMMVHAPTDDRLSEDAPHDGRTFYGVSKSLAEAAALEWAEESADRLVAIVRPAVVFGPQDTGNFAQLRTALERRVFFYVSRSDTVKSCVYIDDVTSAIVHLVSGPVAGVWNLAMPSVTEIGHICGAIQRQLGVAGKLWTVPLPVARLAARVASTKIFSAVSGLRIHPRHMEKLAESTNIDGSQIEKTGFAYEYSDIDSAVAEWFRAEICK